MFRYIFALAILMSFFFCSDSIGQVRPEILPEDLTTGESEIVCLCRPGVRNKSRSKGVTLSYRFVGQGEFEEENTVLSPDLSEYTRIDQFKFDFKVPILLKDHISILAGYQFAGERFNFEQIGNDFQQTFQQLDNSLLKSNSISLIVSKPINETRYFVGRLRYTTNGNYDGVIAFEGRYSIYKALAIYGIKPNEDFEWGIGVSYSNSFRNNNFIPFLLYNRTFNHNWGLEAVLPGFIFVRCNFDQNLIMLGGVEFGSQSYRIDTDQDDNDDVFSYAYNHSELISSVSLEYGLSPWVWLNMKIGYQFNFTSDFESRNEISPQFDADPSSALFFNIGVFISPPSDEDHAHHEERRNKVF